MFRRWLTKARFLFCKLFGRYYVATKCGHKTKLIAEVDIFGKKLIITLNNKEIEYCADCLAKMSIRCAWCGRLIKVGDPVTLNTPRESFQIPDYSVVYNKNPLQLVGCLRWHCTDTGMDRAGFWIIPGKVYRVLSPIEMAIATGACVVVNDITDPNQTIPYPNNHHF